ncbi:MAG TPA: GGDEF domain-containing protein [Solirubrobacterales bacterium]
MPGGAATEDSETRFWLRTVAVGGWVTLLMCIAAAAYTAFFTTSEHRPVLGVLVALTAVVGAAVLWVVPWRRVIASSHREAVLLCWSVLTIGSIVLMASLDGGAGSPFTLALLLPAVFSSLAYELRRVVLIGVLAEAAYLLLSVVGSPGPGYMLVFCSGLGGVIVMAVGQAGFHQEWRAQLARSSRTDPLTGLLNRRGLALASARSFHDLARHRRPLTLLVLDLDLFKAYNDTHGHHAGDELLHWVGAQLSQAVRPEDSVARLGGDEFAILLPDTDRGAAAPLLGRLCESLGSRIPCCIGSAAAPEDGTTFDDLYRVADAALYEQKKCRFPAVDAPASSLPGHRPPLSAVG